MQPTHVSLWLRPSPRPSPRQPRPSLGPSPCSSILSRCCSILSRRSRTLCLMSSSVIGPACLPRSHLPERSGSSCLLCSCRHSSFGCQPVPLGKERTLGNEPPTDCLDA